MDRAYFEKLKFTKGELTKISCPNCARGWLKCQEDTVHMGVGSILDHLDAEDVDFSFSCLLRCNNDDCREVISCCGIARTQRRHDDSPDGWSYYETLFPLQFHPPILLFKLPDDCPESVADHIARSFAVFFSDQTAAGWYVRVATEKLLDEQGIPREHINKKGKEERSSLHYRIDQYSIKESELSHKLMAIKWLGNEAGHGGELTRADVLDGYEVFSYVIDELYKNRAHRSKVASTASAIAAKFKP